MKFSISTYPESIDINNNERIQVHMSKPHVSKHKNTSLANFAKFANFVFAIHICTGAPILTGVQALRRQSRVLRAPIFGHTNEEANIGADDISELPGIMNPRGPNTYKSQRSEK